MIVTTLDFCIRNGYTRLVYGLVDNHTKARMMDSFREQKFYFYARNPLLRVLLKRAYRFLSGYDLHQIDAEAREKRNANSKRTADTIASTGDRLIFSNRKSHQSPLPIRPLFN